MLSQELYVSEKLREFEAARLSRLVVTDPGRGHRPWIGPAIVRLGRFLCRVGETLSGPAAADAEGLRAEPALRGTGVAGQSGRA